jgi:hypothetical protein
MPNKPYIDIPYIDPTGYKPPGCWILPHLEEARQKLRRALTIARSEIPRDAQWHYDLSQRKGEQDRAAQWGDGEDPRIQRFEAVWKAYRATDDAFRSLATEGLPPDLRLARSRTFLETEEADLEKGK